MRIYTCVVILVCLIAATRSANAEPPALTAAPSLPATSTPTLAPFVQLDQLLELGKSVAAIRYESDNSFVYTRRSEELHKAALALQGGQLEFVAQVMRVSQEEVFVEVIPAGKTRIVLIHPFPPTFGNLRTLSYSTVKSGHRFQMFSAPVGLRIGSEINLDVASKLRRRDTLVIRGTIETLPVWIDSVFAPTVVALISNWNVVTVNPPKPY